MGDLTKNISRHEVACKCGCGFDTLDMITAMAVQECCDDILWKSGADKIILHINSGCRCIEHNEVVQKEADENYVPYSSDSEHPKARALDFWVEVVKNEVMSMIDPGLVYAYLNRKYQGKFGVGSYKNFTHLDTKTGPGRRW